MVQSHRTPQSDQTRGARVFRAPGRVNLIGEHTDYNDGFVLPAALSFFTWINLAPLNARMLEIYSENFDESVTCNLDDPDISPRDHWSDYVVGVALILERWGYRLSGARLSIRGEVPLGSGLSSSAALEVAAAYALCAHSNIEIDRTSLARICRQAENEFVGARVGIMDQFASLHGKARHALLLDCRSLEYQYVPLSDRVQLIVCNTTVKHELASSAYNERREQCETGVRLLAARIPNIHALRDVTIGQLEEFRSELPDIVYRRCRHVITENDRTLAAAEALKLGDLESFGKLMYESHESLRKDYEVSCFELDEMVAIASRVDGVLGARMTGGGFGGCTVNLVEVRAIEEFQKSIRSVYEQRTNLKPEIYICEIADGAEEIDLDYELNITKEGSR